MPTIEIASINSTELNLKQEDFDVAIIEEKQLRSHRGLFYDFLQKQKGVIIHIGNPEFIDDKECGIYFAGMIINWDFEPTEILISEFDPNNPTNNEGANQQFRFNFLNQYKSDINKILEIALEKSPIKKVCFLTDYQFGPEKESVEIIYTIDDFWTKHDKEGLTFNTLYELYGH